MPTENGLPASVDAERSILGAVLLDNFALTQAEAIVNPDDFSLDSHRRIFASMVELMASGSAIDFVSLSNELGKKRELESVGGVAYLSSLTDGLPHRCNIEQHAKIVRDKSNLRKIITTCNSTIANAMGQSVTAESCAAELQDGIISIQSRVGTQAARSAKEFMPEVLRELELQASRDGLVGYSVGTDELNNRTTGIRPGELWVVGAMPGRGKTQFGLQVVSENLQQNVPCLVFELEMSDDQLGMRLLPKYSGVEATKIRDPKWISKAEWPSITRAVGEIMQWPLWVDEASSLTTREIVSRARLYIRRHGVKLIVVDYLMLVEEPREKEARHKARRIANAFRQIAKDENVAVVLLSQLSRPRDGNENTRPSMLSLRESGDIEAAANTVLLLYMPFDDRHMPTGEDEVIIGKQRNGWLGTVNVSYDRKNLRFEDRTDR